MRDFQKYLTVVVAKNFVAMSIVAAVGSVVPQNLALMSQTKLLSVAPTPVYFPVSDGHPILILDLADNDCIGRFLPVSTIST